MKNGRLSQNVVSKSLICGILIGELHYVGSDANVSTLLSSVGDESGKNADYCRDRCGIKKVMDQTLQYIGPNSCIHLSFDIDGLDPVWAPSTGFPVANGVPLSDGCYVAQRLYETEKLIAMDLVEINPTVATDGLDRTLEAARTVVCSALGVEGDPE